MQKGFLTTSILLVIFLLLVIGGVGYYVGQRNQLSNSIPANSNQTVTPTSVPEKTTSTVSVPTASPLPTSTPVPTLNLASNNTSNPNAPTSIKVISPNGGESFKVGDTIRITWSSNNLNKSGSCVINLVYENGSKSTSWAPVNTPQGYNDWKLASEAGGHQAKINMECYDSNQTRVTDQSDNFFTVTN